MSIDGIVHGRGGGRSKVYFERRKTFQEIQMLKTKILFLQPATLSTLRATDYRITDYLITPDY